MGHLIADDGSGNRFSTSGHTVITSFRTKSISCILNLETDLYVVRISKDEYVKYVYIDDG